jgi:hypothetical protein
MESILGTARGVDIGATERRLRRIFLSTARAAETSTQAKERSHLRQSVLSRARHEHGFLSLRPRRRANRPQIVPPLEDSSGFGGSGVERPYTTQEKVLEITELLRVKTASSNITLQRLAELESSLGAKERPSLLKTAKSAAAAAQKEYNRMRNIRKPAGSRVSVSARNSEVPLPDVQSDREYVHRVQLQAERLQLGMQGFAAFQEGLGGVGSVKGCLADISATTERRNAGAETAEIRWSIERKCMFWAAVDLLMADAISFEEAELVECQTGQLRRLESSATSFRESKIPTAMRKFCSHLIYVVVQVV